MMEDFFQYSFSRVRREKTNTLLLYALFDRTYK